MALPPALQALSIGAPDAPNTLELYVCPFSAKQLLNFDRDAVPLLIGDEAPFAGQVRVVVRPVPQPWHASSTYLHETALAVARLAPSERAALAHPTTNPFWVFSQALMRESERWYESPVRGKSGDQVRAELAALAVHVLSDEPRRAGTPPLVSLPDDTPLGQAVRAWTRVSDDGNTGAKIVPDLKYCGLSSAMALTHTSLPLPLVAQGKVRDVYDAQLTDGEYRGALLFVATDRISAFDVILQNGIPDKGRVLHGLSEFWFELLTPSILRSHVLATRWDDFPEVLRERLAAHRTQVDGRAMLVRRAQVLPLEAIVRGYLTGSGWSEYKRAGTVHGISLPPGLVESQRIPGGPLFTPSTKAEQGAHDENIHPDRVAELIGQPLADKVAGAAKALYAKAAEHAQSRGILLADTKFEFGLLPPETPGAPDELILVDEVLTPDSSRFWAADTYREGAPQASFDKQYVRDWMKAHGLEQAARTFTPVTLPDDVVAQTAAKYREAYERITGKSFP
ncbi:unnamed protein product [Malassezia sympodialis ATCC 42132]|nr:uncharacterized protein MSY001_1055 [Malassezia sympodialis ATCC 42132]CCU98349.1 unnamed protein product [Malassezia sympodialis ATCC 42132]|eukprot:XP_018739661.1 uncharacterized protein MSY001_1055 [Malassezia sympodialis ATCC 42132]